MMALALASLAISFKPERRPRMSAMHSILPATVSMTLVCVLTPGAVEACRGSGDAPGRVEDEAVRGAGCIFLCFST